MKIFKIKGPIVVKPGATAIVEIPVGVITIKASVTVKRAQHSPITLADVYDLMSAAGYRLDLVTGYYERIHGIFRQR